jgi:uncharacterized DUF497 family protein
MKIPPSFDSAYKRLRPVLESLEEFVKPRIQEIVAKHNAAYSGRIKTAESILIKVEKGDNVYFAAGQTATGRYLIIFFVYKKDRRALILSARDMTHSERRQHERK